MRIGKKNKRLKPFRERRPAGMARAMWMKVKPIFVETFYNKPQD